MKKPAAKPRKKPSPKPASPPRSGWAVVGEIIVGALIVGTAIVAVTIDERQRRCPHTFWRGSVCAGCGITHARRIRLRRGGG